MKTTDLSINEAIKLSTHKGLKIKHRFFTDVEYIYFENGHWFSELGYQLSQAFWLNMNKEWHTGWSVYSESDGNNLPTEDEVLQTIFDCVDIRGINLEEYRYNFDNERSGLYDALCLLFNKNKNNE